MLVLLAKPCLIGAVTRLGARRVASVKDLVIQELAKRGHPGLEVAEHPLTLFLEHTVGGHVTRLFEQADYPSQFEPVGGFAVATDVEQQAIPLHGRHLT